MVDPEELERLRVEAERELQDPRRWGLDFTLVQCWGQRRTEPYGAFMETGKRL